MGKELSRPHSPCRRLHKPVGSLGIPGTFLQQGMRSGGSAALTARPLLLLLLLLLRCRLLGAIYMLRQGLTLLNRSKPPIPRGSYTCLSVASHVFKRPLRHGRDALEVQRPPTSCHNSVCKEPEGRSRYGKRHEHRAQEAHRLRRFCKPAKPVASQKCAQGFQLQRHGCRYVSISPRQREFTH
jgi:hypothetical protein